MDKDDKKSAEDPKSGNQDAEHGKRLIMNGIKNVNLLPAGASRDLYNTHVSFHRIMNEQSVNALKIIQKINVHFLGKRNIVTADKEDQLHILQDSYDSILEKINTSMDEFVGMNKNQPPEVKLVAATAVTNYELLHSASKNSKSNVSQIAKLVTAKNIIRPQFNFSVPVDNSNNPFMPRLRTKPHAIKPFILTPDFDEEGNVISYQHPYATEIDHFEPSDKMLQKSDTKIPEDVESSKFTYVDKVEELKSMLEHLKTANEIGVDVEHHSYRTFLGITCLLQISTKEQDFIIDTIALREELQILNEVFANPSIVKILHGADSDVDWLQRDLSIYIVNLFDTHIASKRLGLPRLSLAYLLKHYCNKDADKTLQLADWRIRPLTEDLMKYAQQDTHYLLYIYDKMKSDLIEASNGTTNLVHSVFKDSKIISSKRYEKPICTAQSYKEICLKLKKSYNPSQTFALMKLYQWRDEIARREDESNQYVLPNHMLIQICEVLPREMQGILACCNPIPPLVRQNLNEIHRIILQARQISSKDTIIVETNTNFDRANEKANTRKDFLDNPLYSPHDYRHHANENEQEIIKNSKIDKIDKIEVQLSAFKGTKLSFSKTAKFVFTSPYEKFKLMIPFMEEMAKKQQQKLEEMKKNQPKIQQPNENIQMIFTPPQKKTENSDANNFMSCSSSRFKKVKNNMKNEESSTSQQSTPQVNEEEFSPHQGMRKRKNQKFSSDNRQSSNRPVDFNYLNSNLKRFKRDPNSNNEFKKSPGNDRNGKKFNHKKFNNFGNRNNRNFK